MFIVNQFVQTCESRMRHQSKLICGKWSNIDPLVMTLSSTKWLCHCFGNVSSGLSWTRVFSFGAAWGVFPKHFVRYWYCRRRLLFLEKVDLRFGEHAVLVKTRRSSRQDQRSSMKCKPGSTKFNEVRAVVLSAGSAHRRALNTVFLLVNPDIYPKSTSSIKNMCFITYMEPGTHLYK